MCGGDLNRHVGEMLEQNLRKKLKNCKIQNSVSNILCTSELKIIEIEKKSKPYHAINYNMPPFS